MDGANLSSSSSPRHSAANDEVHADDDADTSRVSSARITELKNPVASSTTGEGSRNVGGPCSHPGPIPSPHRHSPSSEEGECHTCNHLPLFVPPLPRQEWVKAEGGGGYVSSLSLTHEHRVASHSALVLDLVFVVLTAQVGRAFRAEADVDAVLATRDFFALFCPIWFLWNSQNNCLNKFEQKDTVGSFFFLGNIVAMCLVGVSAERCGSGYARTGCSEFAWAMAGAKLWLTLFHLYVLAFNYGRYKATLLWIHIVPEAAASILWIVVGFLPGGNECGAIVDACWLPFILCWWSAIFVDFLRFFGPLILITLGGFSDKSGLIPLNTHLNVERHEQFIIISLGEIIAACLVSDVVETDHAEDDDATPSPSLGEEETSHNENPNVYALVILMSVLVVLIKLAYFDVAEHPSLKANAVRKHALNRSVLTGTFFNFVHLPLNVAIVMIGSVLEPLKLHGLFTPAAVVILSWCLAGINFILSIFDCLHLGGGRSMRAIGKGRRTMFRAVIVIIYIALPWMKDFAHHPIEFLAAANSIFGVQVCFTLVAFLPKSWHEEPDKSKDFDSVTSGMHGEGKMV